jgi:hypothetical protein
MTLGTTTEVNSIGSTLNASSYPFNFAEAVALTDKQMEDLPPARLFEMADANLKNVIFETK